LFFVEASNIDTPSDHKHTIPKCHISSQVECILEKVLIGFSAETEKILEKIGCYKLCVKWFEFLRRSLSSEWKRGQDLISFLSRLNLEKETSIKISFLHS